MKHFFRTALTALALIAALALSAHAAGNAGYIKQIQEESEGNVTIDIPESVLNILFPPAVSHSGGKVVKQEETRTKGVVLKAGVNKISGWRIQVFGESNNQASLEARARARGSAVAARFPKYRGKVYTYSKSPNWYTRVGDFMTQAEANAALSELKRAFPQFAGEMRLVKCTISIIK